MIRSFHKECRPLSRRVRRPFLARAGYAVVAIGVMAWSLLLGPNPAAAQWSVITGAETIYTDNVFGLSASRRLALSEDPSQPVRFSFGQLSDVVWKPSLDLRRTMSSSLGSTELSIKGEGFLYTNHGEFNNGDYNLQVRQQVASDTWLLLRYRYLPNLLLGPNIERQSGNDLLMEERVTEHSWRVQYEKHLTERWQGMVLGRFGIRRYNDAFSERDTNYGSLGSRIQFSPVSWALLTLDYLYERGLADGRHEPQYKDDVSYWQHFISFGTRCSLSHRLALELTYAYRIKTFTSSIVGDVFNGAIDYLHQGTAQVLYNLTPQMQLTMAYQRTQRSSNVVSRDFFNNNISLGLQYRF
ncbi:outer membrane beta-barrel protein [Petrachloros mirabilis]